MGFRRSLEWNEELGSKLPNLSSVKKESAVLPFTLSAQRTFAILRIGSFSNDKKVQAKRNSRRSNLVELWKRYRPYQLGVKGKEDIERVVDDDSSTTFDKLSITTTK